MQKFRLQNPKSLSCYLDSTSHFSAFSLGISAFQFDMRFGIVTQYQYSGYRIMVIISAFQAEDDGSIPFTRSDCKKEAH